MWRLELVWLIHCVCVCGCVRLGLPLIYSTRAQLFLKLYSNSELQVILWYWVLWGILIMSQQLEYLTSSSFPNCVCVCVCACVFTVCLIISIQSPLRCKYQPIQDVSSLSVRFILASAVVNKVFRSFCQVETVKVKVQHWISYFLWVSVPQLVKWLSELQGQWFKSLKFFLKIIYI